MTVAVRSPGQGFKVEHSIPFETEARHGSVRVRLYPAPRGVGIVANKEAKKLLMLAGIKDIWVKTFGQTRTRGNFICSVFEALKNLSRTKGEL